MPGSDFRESKDASNYLENFDDEIINLLTPDVITYLLTDNEVPIKYKLSVLKHFGPDIYSTFDYLQLDQLCKYYNIYPNHNSFNGTPNSNYVISSIIFKLTKGLPALPDIQQKTLINTQLAQYYHNLRSFTKLSSYCQFIVILSIQSEKGANDIPKNNLQSCVDNIIEFLNTTPDIKIVDVQCFLDNINIYWPDITISEDFLENIGFNFMEYLLEVTAILQMQNQPALPQINSNTTTPRSDNNDVFIKKLDKIKRKRR